MKKIDVIDLITTVGKEDREVDFWRYRHTEFLVMSTEYFEENEGILINNSLKNVNLLIFMDDLAPKNCLIMVESEAKKMSLYRQWRNGKESEKFVFVPSRGGEKYA